MPSNSHDHVLPLNAAGTAFLESLVRADYERSRPGETFDDMKRRLSFSKEDQGLYRDWMALAATRAKALRATDRVPVAA